VSGFLTDGLTHELTATPPPRPPRRTRVWAWVAVGLVVVLLGVIVVPLVRPLIAGDHLDTAAVEQQVAASLTGELGVTVTVTCPSRIPLEAGRTDECTASADDGRTATVLVSQTDDRGDVVWRLGQ
jgi:xanthosine utilization system XapX-like protein